MVKIGMLDSGVGGLTIVKAVHQGFPFADIVFVGDNLRAPYGSRSKEELEGFASQLIDFLASQEVDLIVIACNTISALNLDDLADRYNLPIFGIIGPTALLAHQLSSNHRIALIATEKTIESQHYQTLLKDMVPSNLVYDLPTPSFVPLVEGNHMGTSRAGREVGRVLRYFDDKDFDVLILGCTHYPFLAEEIKATIEDHVILVDASMAICQQIDSQIKSTDKTKKGNIHLFTTAEEGQFKDIAQSFLGDCEFELSQIHLD